MMSLLITARNVCYLWQKMFVGFAENCLLFRRILQQEDFCNTQKHDTLHFGGDAKKYDIFKISRILLNLTTGTFIVRFITQSVFFK